MARWGKNVVVPLESLIKEKENTNRPTAARSAGTVGKWGKMGFTSTRTYALKSLPTTTTPSPANSPEGGGGIGDSPIPAVSDVPKPKKFFKSRNTTIDTAGQNIYHLPRAPPSPIRSEGHSPSKREPPLKLKIPKIPMERKKSTSSDKGAKIKKKKEEKKLKPEAPPSRIISRNRKIVNYNEDDDDRSQTPLKDIIEKFAAVQTRRESPLAVTQPEAVPNDSPIVMEPPVVKAPPVEHPPIVLRISKGTSRLISTDSEDLLNSPIHEPPTHEQPMASTAEIRNVETEEIEKPEDLRVVANESEANLDESIIEPVVDEPEVNDTVPPPEELPVKHESLKIIIKASALEKPEKKSKNKRHHKTASGHKVTEHTFKTPSPQPGNDNYDLYRTLAVSPSERDFDSQSSILGSISSKETSQFPVVMPDESCVIRSRGSSDITSDVETSQHSSLVAVPSDIESRLESMMDCDDDEPTTERTPDLNTVDRLNAIVEEPLTEDILDVLTGGEIEDDKTVEESVASEAAEEIDKPVVTPRRTTRGRKAATKSDVLQPAIVEELPKASGGRVTRNNNNGCLKNKKTPDPPAVRSYTRKCKTSQVQSQPPASEIPMSTDSPIIGLDTENITPASRPESVNINLPDAPPISDILPNSDHLIDDLDNQKPIVKEYKIKNKFKRAWCDREASKSTELDDAIDEPPSTKSKTTFSTSDNSLSSRNAIRSSKIVNNNTESGDNDTPTDDEKRSVKLVISKKKGSIFKSRALVTEQGNGTKRHVYKHTWDADKEKSANAEGPSTPSVSAEPSLFDDDDFNEEENTTSKLTRLTRQNMNNKFEQENVTSVKCDKKAKEYYTVVRNVKTAHQIQEIGEYQEMDDDVEYILDALQPQNPIATRCLSALQLASKCMVPAFRMHVRAHGTATKFFKALKDAKKDLSLGLCTATIMFVLSQDRLNMDLDRESLELMINLLGSDVDNTLDEFGMTSYERNKQKVKELCEEIKSQGKAAHLNIDSITVGTLAMETLLSLTSKRAGEWFKEELRELGGLDHIIKTICECCRQISDYVVSWTDILLDKLKTIERCLRVLENVSEQDEQNQNYILLYNNGYAIDTLFKLYKLCDSEIALYPTTDSTPKENPGVVLREALVPTLKVLINLTHPFNDKAIGSAILGERAGIFDTSFHILLQAPNYVPELCIFELSILVLYLLINLTMHTVPNRMLIMKSHAPSDFGNQFDKVPAIKALIEYFYKCEEQARLAEQNTDAILENPADTKKTLKSQEEVDETVSKLLQKAGHHMEHTMKASYAGLLIGHLISGSDENEKVIRSYLNDNSFKDIISILEKYYNFMNLTASSEAISHIKSTRKLIDYFQKCDTHSNDETTVQQSSTSSSMMTTRSTPRVYKTYSQR